MPIEGFAVGSPTTPPGQTFTVVLVELVVLVVVLDVVDSLLEVLVLSVELVNVDEVDDEVLVVAVLDVVSVELLDEVDDEVVEVLVVSVELVDVDDVVLVVAVLDVVVSVELLDEVDELVEELVVLVDGGGHPPQSSLQRAVQRRQLWSSTPGQRCPPKAESTTEASHSSPSSSVPLPQGVTVVDVVVVASSRVLVLVDVEVLEVLSVVLELSEVVVDVELLVELVVDDVDGVVEETELLVLEDVVEVELDVEAVVDVTTVVDVEVVDCVLLVVLEIEVVKLVVVSDVEVVLVETVVETVDEVVVLLVVARPMVVVVAAASPQVQSPVQTALPGQPPTRGSHSSPAPPSIRPSPQREMSASNCWRLPRTFRSPRRRPQLSTNLPLRRTRPRTPKQLDQRAASRTPPLTSLTPRSRTGGQAVPIEMSVPSIAIERVSTIWAAVRSGAPTTS